MHNQLLSEYLDSAIIHSNHNIQAITTLELHPQTPPLTILILHLRTTVETALMTTNTIFNNNNSVIYILLSCYLITTLTISLYSYGGTY